MVSMLAFYSDDPSSIPAEVYNFFCKIVVEKNKNKQKEAGVGPIFLKKTKKKLYVYPVEKRTKGLPINIAYLEC